MALKHAIHIMALAALQTASSNEAIPITGDFVLPAGLANGDILEMAGIPAGYVPVDLTLAAEDLETGTTMTIDAGVLSGAYGAKDQARTCGAEFIAASIVGRAGGVARCDKAQGLMLAPVDVDRGVGIRFGVIGTPIVGAKVRLTLWVRPAVFGA